MKDNNLSFFTFSAPFNQNYFFRSTNYLSFLRISILSEILGFQFSLIDPFLLFQLINHANSNEIIYVYILF